PLDGLQRRLLRQRRRRELLLHAQERTRPPPIVAGATRADVRSLRVHRGLLQPNQTPLDARLPLAAGLREQNSQRARCWRSPLRSSHPLSGNQLELLDPEARECPADRAHSIVLL